MIIRDVPVVIDFSNLSFCIFVFIKVSQSGQIASTGSDQRWLVNPFPSTQKKRYEPKEEKQIPQL